MLFHHTRQRICQILALEQPLADDELIQDHAEGPDIGARIHAFPASLLGSHIGGGPKNHPSLRRGHADGGRILGGNHGPSADLRQAEIQNLDRCVRLDLDVGRLQIAMDYSLVVRFPKRFGDLPR
jgi:hypothetical protein